MTKEKVWTGIRIVLHILGCALFMFIFSRVNVCRFYLFSHPYFEWIIAVLIMLVGYSFYFFFVRKYYITGFFVKFWLVFAGCIVLLTLIESLFIFSEHEYLKIFDAWYLKKLQLQSFGLMFARNATLVGLLVLLRMNHYYRKNYTQERKTNIQVSSIYNIVSNKTMITLNVDEIMYVQHQKNYTYFYMMDGRSYSQYISLVKVMEELPEDLFVYANRNTLINTKFHYTCKGGMLYFNEGVANQAAMEGISISKHYKNDLMDKIIM